LTYVVDLQRLGGTLEISPAEAQRRDTLDAELRYAVPAISANPEAVTGAKLVSWLSVGLINVTTADNGMGASRWPCGGQRTVWDSCRRRLPANWVVAVGRG
jgi:hypothetical protein